MPHPEVFNTIPDHREDYRPGYLPWEKIEQFFNEGYCVVENFFNPEELEQCRKDIAELVDNLANKLYAAGKIKNLYKDFGFFERLTKLEAEFPGANIMLHKHSSMTKGFRELFSHPRMLDMVSQIIGHEISGSAIWNLRTKTPQNEATVVPWHQDAAYFDDESYKTMIVTAWIPLIDATVENGCLQVVKNGHKSGKIAKHECCAGPTWYVMVEEEEMEKSLDIKMERDTITCPVPYGGFILFNNITPHRSLPNLSNDIRWSLDLRWQKTEAPDCFFGLKGPIQLRTEKDPDFKIEWEEWDSQDRSKIQTENVGKKFDEFDTTISGPWMNRWEIVNHNRHTASLDTAAGAWVKA